MAREPNCASSDDDAPRNTADTSGERRATRPATIPQLYRLNQLNCIKLAPPGEGEKIDFTTADEILRATAERGLWTPKHPRPIER